MKENLYTENCIRTYSGIYMNVFEPTLDMICIEDIAHSLSMQCRFGGHLPRFYSVAQHSINCCNYVPEEYKLDALMHDAAEGYLLDMPSPIKKLLPDYKILVKQMEKLIAKKYGLDYPFKPVIHEADSVLLKHEWDNIMINDLEAIHCWTSEVSKKTFLDYFEMYKH